ncbi:hypothetical protein MMC31_000777, partial [Peltigera leucophlebia]|nr:hypothetical protein [Peltigera leucophlebia]
RGSQKTILGQLASPQKTSLASQSSTTVFSKPDIFYRNTRNQTLAYLLKTTLQDGVGLYSDHTIMVNSTTITANFQNSPLVLELVMAKKLLKCRNPVLPSKQY